MFQKFKFFLNFLLLIYCHQFPQVLFAFLNCYFKSIPLNRIEIQLNTSLLQMLLSIYFLYWDSISFNFSFACWALSSNSILRDSYLISISSLTKSNLIFTFNSFAFSSNSFLSDSNLISMSSLRKSNFIFTCSRSSFNKPFLKEI